MNLSFNISELKNKTNPGLILLILAFLVPVLFFLREYFFFDIHLILGVVLAPMIFNIQKGNYSYRYVLPFILFLGISYFIPLSTFYYFSILLGFLLLAESLIGKINYASLYLLLTISPVFKYITTFFGFPIRLKLSEMAGSMLNHIGYTAEVLGNMIILDGHEFSVDPACMGLKMLAVSFILTLLMYSYYEKKLDKRSSLFMITLVMILSFGLNILCNLLRIIVLVIFNFPPSNPFHDLAGILCLIIYVLIPLNFIIPLILKYANEKKVIESERKSNSTLLSINGIAYIAIILLGLKINQEKTEAIIDPTSFEIPGYQKQVCGTDVMKFENDDALIYVKPVRSFYGAEHNPMICWVGSGYEFKQIKKQTINQIEIYTGILQRKDDLIYAAWWFDNGKTKTIDQLNWRWNVLKGNDQFSLVNVNALSMEKLKEETSKILKQNIYKN